MADDDTRKLDGISRFLGRVMDGPLPAMLMLLGLAVGAAALVVTPREEEPQIIVPLADVLVSAPGLGAEQVERQISTPLEHLLYQIDGVEYVYSRSLAGASVVTIEEVVPSAHPGSRSFVVKTRLPADSTFFPGMFGRLLIPYGTVERYYVPERAIVRVGQFEFVNVVENSHVVRRYVRTGMRAGDDRVVVLSGLETGERVVIPDAAVSR